MLVTARSGSGRLRMGILSAAIAAPVTVMVALIYLAVQQSYRQTANDPQIAMAEDAARALVSGRDPIDVTPRDRVDFGKSLSPYLMVLDDAGKPLASSGELDGRVPRVPSGVLGYARNHGENRVTWQPGAGVRSAIIVVRFAGANPGFVVAGRSLREVEAREDQLRKFVGAAWLISIVAVLTACVSGCLIESAVAGRNGSRADFQAL